MVEEENIAEQKHKQEMQDPNEDIEVEEHNQVMIQYMDLLQNQ